MGLICSIGVYPFLIEFCFAEKTQLKFFSGLDGANEVPPNNSTGSGSAWFKLKNETIFFKLSVTGLDKITKAHIHNGTTGKEGDIIVTLFKPDNATGRVNGILAEGNFTAKDLKGSMKGKSMLDFVSSIKANRVYINIHTEYYPHGEIRGQILSVLSKPDADTW